MITGTKYHGVHEEYEVPQHEVGLTVTCFCPICKAQVFGYLFAATIDDLVAHMNEAHPRPKTA